MSLMLLVGGDRTMRVTMQDPGGCRGGGCDSSLSKDGMITTAKSRICTDGIVLNSLKGGARL